MNRLRLLYIAIMFMLLALAACVVFVAATLASPPAQPSCSTPAATFATLTACRTETARALTPRVVMQTQTPVPTRSVTPAPAVTPTKVTGTEAPGCWVVGQGVRFKFSPCSFGVTQVP